MLSRRLTMQLMAMALLGTMPLHTRLLAIQQAQTATVTLTIEGMT